MFNVGPLELLLIFVVALLVIGPERLPGTVKTCSLWIGRFRRNFHKIKAEIEQELNADEIRRQIYNESVLEELNDAKNQVNSMAKNIEGTFKENGKENGKESGKELVPAINPDKQTEKKEPQVKSGSIANPLKVSESNRKSIIGELKDVAAQVNEAGKQVKLSGKQIETEFNSSNADTSSEKT